jgi:hypothetical protein
MHDRHGCGDGLGLPPVTWSSYEWFFRVVHNFTFKEGAGVKSMDRKEPLWPQDREAGERRRFVNSSPVL